MLIIDNRGGEVNKVVVLICLVFCSDTFGGFSASFDLGSVVIHFSDELDLYNYSRNVLSRGDFEGNGGDAGSAHFYETLERIGVKLGVLNFDGVSPESLRAAVLDYRIGLFRPSLLCGSKLSINGGRVDAINFPKRKLLLLDCGKYKSLNDKERELLVLHESLHLAGLDDYGYELSAKLYTYIFSFDHYRRDLLDIAGQLLRSSMRCDIKGYGHLRRYKGFGSIVNTQDVLPLGLSALLESIRSNCHFISSDLLFSHGSSLRGVGVNGVSYFLLFLSKLIIDYNMDISIFGFATENYKYGLGVLEKVLENEKGLMLLEVYPCKFNRLAMVDRTLPFLSSRRHVECKGHTIFELFKNYDFSYSAASSDLLILPQELISLFERLPSL